MSIIQVFQMEYQGRDLSLKKVFQNYANSILILSEIPIITCQDQWISETMFMNYLMLLGKRITIFQCGILPKRNRLYASDTTKLTVTAQNVSTTASIV